MLQRSFLLYIKIICLSLLLAFTSVVNAQSSDRVVPKPNPARLVVDNAHLLSAHDEQLLEQKLVAINDSTSNQIVVLTLPTLNGNVVEDVALETFRAWGIGDKKNNNGVLLLIAVQERKIRIEVGYGLEGAIPDVVAKHIIRDNIAPAFKQQNYVAGINAAVDDIARAAIGEYKIKKDKAAASSGSGIGAFIIIFIIIIVILSIIKNNRGGGGSNYRRSPNAFDIIAPILFNGGGWRGGGNSGGGGFGDFGGFGGFGGGSSGGGGASGDW